MKITSDRWHMVSIPLMAAIMLYFAAGDFNRHTTGSLVAASFMLWNAAWVVAFYVWWWPRRQAVQPVITKRAPRARIILMSSILASALISAGLMVGGIGLLEQDILGLQILGILLLVCAALVLPVWFLWLIRWSIRRSGAATG
jgi:hypothetical protein